MNGDVCFATADDADGSVYVVGEYLGTFDFGDGPRTSMGSTGSDAFLAKYSGSGTFEWVRTFPATEWSRAVGVGVAPSGLVLATGTFSGLIDLGDVGAGASMGSDLFLTTVMPADGSREWSTRRVDPGDVTLWRAVMDRNTGTVAFCGNFSGALQVDPATTLVAADGSDAFLFRAFTAPEVAVLWGRSFGGSGDDLAAACATGPVGEVLWGGMFSMTADLGGATFTSVAPSDAAFAVLESGGTHRWSTAFGGSGNDYVSGLAAGPDGSVYAAGGFAGLVPISDEYFMSNGQDDLIVARFAP
jgi:hypothetical protein